MNTISHTLSTLLATALGVVLWVAAGLAAFAFTSVLVLGLAVAGLWAMLTGRKAWWTQLSEARKQAKGMWRARQTGTSSQSAQQAAQATQEQTEADDAPSAATARAPLAQRRFGRAARLGVTDVQPREAH